MMPREQIDDRPKPGLPPQEYYHHSSYYYKLRSTALSMLRRVPHWWDGTRESWEHCVRSNFCDVLE